MKKFYGKEEKRIEKLKPKVETLPELKKRQKGKRESMKKINIKKYLQEQR